MDARGFQQYKEQSVSTMTNNELLLLVLDELTKRITRAELALGKQDYELFDASVDRCAEIVRYLDNTLNHKYEISGQLHRLYDFFLYEFSRIKYGRSQEQINKVKPMLIVLRDTFHKADKNSSEGK